MTDIALRYHHHTSGHHGNLGTTGTIVVIVFLALLAIGYGLYKYNQGNAGR